MDEIKPTPRNKLTGLLADALQGGLEFATNNGKNKPMNLLAELLALPAIQKTTDRLSYGEPLTSGKGFTTRLQPETFDAAMGVLPFAGSMGRGANFAAEGLNKGAAMIGKAATPSTERLVNAVMAKGGLPAQLMQDMAQGTKSPAIVWHGSPHKLDSFDSSKIGTGQGQASYGYGTNLADSPSFASDYMGAAGPVLDNSFIHTVNGNEITNPSNTLKNIIRSGGSEKFISSMQKKLNSQFDELSKASKVDELGLGLSDFDIAKMQLADTQKIIDEAKGYLGKKLDYRQKGNLYQVDLPDEHISKMLDFDNPLSKQSQEIQVLAKNYGLTDTDHLGGDLLQAMNGKLRSGAESMRDAGVFGVKYNVDGFGSSGKGAGTSNYVVFPGNERLLKILERNGEGLAPKYPQSQALELAQQRAALPVSEGGLGLPANNTAMDRANVMFPNDVYHGTNADIQAFDTLLSDTRRKTGTPNGAIVTSTNPKTASTYAGEVTDDWGNIARYDDGGNILPLKINTGNGLSVNAKGANWGDIFSPKYPDAETTNDIAQIALDKGKQSATIKNVLDNATWSKQNGVDSRLGNTIFSFNPDDIRSRFAAFDPWRRNAAIAATMGVAAPDLLANPLDDKNNRLIDILRNK